VLSGRPEYTPKARPLNNEGATFWQNLYQDVNDCRRNWLERDLYEYTWEIVDGFTSGGSYDSSGFLEGLRQCIISGKLPEFYKNWYKFQMAYMTTT